MRADEVSSELGGDEKADQLHNIAKEMKKFAMTSLKRSLSEVLPVSLEEHILENILGYLKMDDEDDEEASWLETSEEDKAILTPIYFSLSQIYCSMRGGLFNTGPGHGLTPEAIDHLRCLMSDFSEREKNKDQVEEGDNEEGEIKDEGAGNQVGQKENQLEKI